MTGAGEPPPPPPAATDLGIPGIVDAAEIGRGGFAVVYRARRTGFDQSVAVKVLAAALDQESRSRFDREVRAMGALFGHPFIVGIITAGYTVADRPYIVMEDMTGGSLAERIRSHGPLSWQDATRIGDGLASALEAAHSAHVLHRDVKPENVLFSRYGAAKLGDFGLAAFTEGPETRSSAIMVSVAHTAPEVLDGAPRTASTDVYGLASTIMTMVLGRPPFARGSGETSGAVFKRIATEPPPDLRGLGVPDTVCRVLERALAKTAEQRYPTATEFRADLDRARNAATVAAPSSPPASDSDRTEAWVPETQAPAVASARSTPAARRGITGNRRLLAVAGGAAAAIVVVVVLAVALLGKKPAPPAPSPGPPAVSAAKAVAAGNSARLVETLLSKGFSTGTLPSGWSVTSTDLGTYLSPGLMADVQMQLGGPAASAIYADYDIFSSAAAAGRDYASGPPLPSGFTQVSTFSTTGISDQSSCTIGHQPATSSLQEAWAASCQVLSANVETFTTVQSAARNDSGDESLVRTLTLQSIRNLNALAAATPNRAVMTPPATLNAEGLYGQLAGAPLASSLQPEGITSSGSPQVYSTGLSTGPSSRIAITLKGPDAGDFIQFFVFNSPDAAKSWWSQGLSPTGSTAKGSLDASGFPAGTGSCGNFSVPDSNNDGGSYGSTDCYVVYGNVVVQGETNGDSGTTQGNPGLTYALTRAGMLQLDQLDGEG